MTPPERALRLGESEPTGFQPGLRVGDEVGRWWLRQVELRVRRELAWLWRDPARADDLVASLEGLRFDGERRRFFESDLTAAWLTKQLDDPVEPTPAPRSPGTPRGFGHLVEALALTPVERFVLALALLPSVDGAVGPALAACCRDTRLTHPTRRVAQHLWDDPVGIPLATGPGSALVRHGILAPGGWHDALEVPPSLAHALLLPHGPLPELRTAARGDTPPTLADAELLRARLQCADDTAVVVPLALPAGGALEPAGAAVADLIGRSALTPVSGCALHPAALRLLAWLRDAVLVLPGGRDAVDGEGLRAAPMPGVVVVPADEAGGPPGASGSSTGSDAATDMSTILAPVPVGPLDAEARLARWRAGLGPLMSEGPVAATVRDEALRLHLEGPAIDDHCRVLRALGRPLTPGDVRSVVRRPAAAAGLAQQVQSRFTLGEVVLPEMATRQLRELVSGARVLATVHHRWGTARAWREGGLTALFAGPSGTGKTMAAEAVAHELDRPLTRIDLSQVVDKYIGETEKNLRRVFDAAEGADAVLFFDEADALFGKRTEVKDAHDRYANLEVSYLLERMERFRGVAILASNRRRDLDDAFLRRLRWVVEFPLPDAELRRRLWAGALPEPVDTEAIEVEALAERFTLTGGQIRSAVFHACLDAAARHDREAPPRLTMASVVRAVRAELEKAGRAVSRDRFGAWAAHLEEA